MCVGRVHDHDYRLSPTNAVVVLKCGGKLKQNFYVKLIAESARNIFNGQDTT